MESPPSPSHLDLRLDFIQDPRKFNRRSWSRRGRAWAIRIRKSSVADPGCLSRIRIFFVSDSHQRILRILTQKMVSRLSEIWSGLFIPDLDPDFCPFRIRIQGSKRHRIRIRKTAKICLKGSDQWVGRGFGSSSNHEMVVGEVVLGPYLSFYWAALLYE